MASRGSDGFTDEALLQDLVEAEKRWTQARILRDWGMEVEAAQSWRWGARTCLRRGLLSQERHDKILASTSHCETPEG